MTVGPFRDSAIVASILESAPTIVMAWPGLKAGTITSLVAHNVGLGVGYVSLYILPREVTAASSVYLIGPKEAELPAGLSLDWELKPGDLILNRGDQLAAVGQLASRTTVVVGTKEWEG